MQANRLILEQAKEIARHILGGKCDPNDGCEKLSELCARAGWPPELLGFYALAHEQTGHEQLGFDRENTAPLIIDECNALLKEQQ
jgi:hypothetical protein